MSFKPPSAPLRTAAAPISRYRPDDSGNWLDAAVLLDQDRAGEQRQIGQLSRQVERLRDALAERDAFIAALQEQLAECQANQITDTDDLIAALAVIEAEIDAERMAR